MFATYRVCVGVMMIVAGMVSAAAAQQTGAVYGTVKDAQGGVLPGVTVAAVSGTTAPRSTMSNEQGAYSLSGLPTGTYSLTFELVGFQRPEADEVIGPGQPHHPRRRRDERRRAAGNGHRERRLAGRRRQLDDDPDQHHEGALRGHSDRPQSVGDGGPRARRRHRPARRRRHRGHAAVQPRGLRLGRQPEVVQHRRPEDQLAGRQRRLDDAVLRLRDVRGIQHADGVGQPRRATSAAST